MKAYRPLLFSFILLYFFIIPIASANQTIKIGIYQNYPLSFSDGKGLPKGIAIDVLGYIADKAAWQTQYITGSWEQCLQRLKRSEIDLLCSIAYSSEFAKQYDFTSEPLLINWARIYIHNESPIRTINDLNQKRIAVMRGDIHANALKRMLSQFGLSCEFVEVDSYRKVLDMVSTKSAAAGVANRLIDLKLTRQLKIVKSDIVFNPIQVHYAVSKGKNNRIIATIDSYLSVLKQKEGSIYYRSLARWLGLPAPEQVSSKWVKWVLAIIIGLLGILYLGNQRLRLKAKVQNTKLNAEPPESVPAKKTFQTSDIQWHDIVNNAEIGIYQVSKRGRFLFVNSKLAQILGYQSPTAFMDAVSNFSQLYLDSREELSHMEQLNHTGALKNVEVRFLRSDTKVVWIQLNSRAIKSAIGKNVYEGFMVDISHQKRAEQLLEESKDLYQSLVELLPEAIFVHYQCIIIYINPKGARLLGARNTSAVIGKNILDFIHADDRQKARLRIAQTAKLKTSLPVIDERVIRIDGNIIDVEATAASILYKDKPAILSVIRDITRRKKIELQKKRLESHFLQAQKMEAIGTLAGGIAHDFNALLKGFQKQISLLTLEGQLSTAQEKSVSRIEDYVKSASGLTLQLLSFAREGKYEETSTDINQLIDEQRRIFMRTKKEIKIHTKFQNNIWRADVDQTQIKQALLTLFANACQSMPSGGEIILQTKNIVLHKKFSKLYKVTPGKYICIAISDTGTGMDEATKNRIFEPFFTTKEMGRGTGLGLASVYGLVKNHNGYINVESEKGKGTTFCIYLPASQKEESVCVKKRSRKISKGSGTVLLIDDEPLILDVARELLPRMGYKALTAASSKEGLDIFKNKWHDIDIVLLDMIMPEMGGEEIYEALKQINPNVKVLLASGYSMGHQAKSILDKGCNGFIQKPFTPKILSQKILEILQD